MTAVTRRIAAVSMQASNLVGYWHPVQRAKAPKSHVLKRFRGLRFTKKLAFRFFGVALSEGQRPTVWSRKGKNPKLVISMAPQESDVFPKFQFNGSYSRIS